MKLLLMLLALSCAFTVEPTSFTSRALAGEGGKGGGSTSPADPSNSAQIISLIANVKTPVRYALKNIQGAFTVGNSQNSKLLYVPDKQGKTLYDLIDTLSFVPKVDGMCEDKLNHNESKDASAFNDNPNEICMSVDGLLKKVNGENAYAKIVALAVHEVVHRKLGTTDEIESFARSVQDIVENNLHERNEYTDPASKMAYNLDIQYLKYRVHDYDDLAKFSGESKCVLLGSVGGNYNLIWSAVTNGQGLMLMSSSQAEFYIESLRFRTDLFSMYCFDDNALVSNNAEGLKWMQKVFADGDDTTILAAKKRLAVSFGENSSTIQQPDAPLHRIHYHNDDDLNLELERLQSGLTNFQRVIQNEEKLARADQVQANLVMKTAQAARTNVENQRIAKAAIEKANAPHPGCRKTPEFLADAAWVKENDVKTFDARSFALAMAYTFKLDKVIVESVTPHLTLLRKTDPNSVNITYSIIRNEKKFTTTTSVRLSQDPKLGQILTIDVGLGKTWAGQVAHPWKDTAGQEYDPYIDRAHVVPNRTYQIDSQEVARKLQSAQIQEVCK